jgi:hypothetical protein
MSLQQLAEEFWRWTRIVLWHLFPQTAVRWRNGVLWQSAGFRWGVLLGCVFLSAAFWSLLQLTLHQTGLWVGQVGLRQNLTHEIESIKSQALQLQAEGATETLWLAQKQAALNDRLAESDAQVAEWLNSALRMPLLSQLQTRATQSGLQVIELKVAPAPDAHGFESSRLSFQMKGSERATYAYWQTLNQLLRNGVWLNLSWLLQADGQYLMTAQLNLWWDAQDAMTDTGVEVRWQDALVPKSHEPRPHVFPEQSHTHMRLVGTGLSGATWALVKSGQQVLPIYTGQYLGSERAKVQFANAQGLWGAVDDGPLQKLLVWEAVTP